MPHIFASFLTYILPTYFFSYMALDLFNRNRHHISHRLAAALMSALGIFFLGEFVRENIALELRQYVVVCVTIPAAALANCLLVHLIIVLTTVNRRKIRFGLLPVYAPLVAYLIVAAAVRDPSLFYYTDFANPGRSQLNPGLLAVSLPVSLAQYASSIYLLLRNRRIAADAKVKQKIDALLYGILFLFGWSLLFVVLLPVLSGSDILESLIFWGVVIWGMSVRWTMLRYDFLPSSALRFHALFELSPASILLLDSRGTIMDANPSAGQLLGMPPSSLKRRSFFTFVPEETRDQFVDRYLSSFERYERLSNQESILITYKGEQLIVLVDYDHFLMDSEQWRMMLIRDITALKQAQERLRLSEQRYKDLALSDPLTGLGNRRHFYESLRSILEDAADSGSAFAIAMVDADSFKSINDAYGHDTGDLALQTIADALRASVQEGDLAGRLGGDEFAVILTSCTTVQQASAFADRLYRKLDKPMYHAGNAIPLGVSIGIALYPVHGTEESALLKMADSALYRSKREGRNRATIA